MIDHGTPQGFLQGCKTIHCPAAMPCKEVYKLYSGDWSFKKKYDAGMTLEEIMRPPEPTVIPIITPKPKRRVQKRSSLEALQRRSDKEDLIRELHAKNYLDKDMVPLVGLERRSIQQIRASMGLPANRKIDRQEVRQLLSEGFNDRQIAEKLNKNWRSIQAIRLKLAKEES